jgi:hypothetical protein
LNDTLTDVHATVVFSSPKRKAVVLAVDDDGNHPKKQKFLEVDKDALPKLLVFGL